MTGALVKRLLLLFLLWMPLVFVSQNIPDYDFETWNDQVYHFPTGMQTSGSITQLEPGFTGNFAIKIQASPGGELVGEFGYGNLNGNQFTGGIPFAASPDSITGEFAYKIAPTDTAWMFVILKSNGAIVGSDSVFFTGTSNIIYTLFKSQIHYRSVAPPDSLILILTSTRPSVVNASSYLLADDLSFLGTTLTIPNGNMETWYARSFYAPPGWTTQNILGLTTQTYPVTDTSDAFGGKYACRLTNINQGSYFQRGYAYVGTETANTLKPGIPATGIDSVFTGYYKYLPNQGDTATFLALMYRHDTLVGSGVTYVTDTAKLWTPFVVQISYTPGFKYSPDSVAVLVAAYKWTSPSSIPRGNSILEVDELSFNEFLTGLQPASMVSQSFSAAPNPFTDQTQLTFTLNAPQTVTFALYDITGRCVQNGVSSFYTEGTHTTPINRQGLSDGVYFIRLQTGGESKTLKVVVGL